ncbi:HlyD family secretion protein [Mucilaginibacter sp. BJC16-A38]|uniref:HlyD family secretion protein n=1 Tax=Mucilaginibacter phenanthrenivorans TaxID=1234842 RepID=UPI00215767A8|nr:HlyD family secretion protein [Mucilaginibacter phenanthrenivorans]MCR8561021.1 HlyD family secretion protein [Mucilaginibacter phenanthrenivorans]
MPTIYANDSAAEGRHTDEMQDIITAVPGWLLRWGISLFFGILVLIVLLGALIKYPDIVNAQLKVDSPNSPKPVVSKISGKLVQLLVQENETVKAGAPLAYLESTANHAKVLALLTTLQQLQAQVLQNRPLNNVVLNQSDNVEFGELQSAYQAFSQEYIAYKATIDNGFLVKKKVYLQKDLTYISQQQQQLNAEKIIQQKDFALAGDEYEMHKKLVQQRVETKAELRQEESKYLAKQSPLLQTQSSIMTNENNYAAKQKEILELDNQVQEEKTKFMQALNSLVSTAEDWKSKYVLSASQAGKLSFAGIIQENQVLSPGQEVFYIDPGNEAFFGNMTISQNNMGKVKEGQQVLVKLKSYPFEEYGMIRGRIKYIADVPYKDSVFISRVEFKINNSSDLKKPIHLKQGMMADAEIITQDATILQRLTRSFFKILGTK